MKKLLIASVVVMCVQFLPVADVAPGSPLINVAEARVRKTVRVRTHIRPNGTQVETYTWTRRRR